VTATLTSPDIRDKSHSTLFWYRNDGTGQFKRLVIFRDEPGWFERHAIADIDGNGALDVAIINNQKGSVVWFANSGTPGAGPWRRHVISDDCPRAYDVALADFDRDGDVDAATAGYVSNQVAWYENPGKDQLTPSPKTVPVEVRESSRDPSPPPQRSMARTTVFTYSFCYP